MKHCKLKINLSEKRFSDIFSTIVSHGRPGPHGATPYHLVSKPCSTQGNERGMKREQKGNERGMKGE